MIYIQSNDDMIYTYVNMYIAFVMDVRDWDQGLKMGVENSILVRLRIWRTGWHTSTNNF